jgi:4-amino-4-deoxy-L-arabinose transferase-like glycosyltransferase
MRLSSVPPVPVPFRASARVDTVLRYCVTAVCAGSAGVHAALIGPHLEEGGLPLGLAFAAAAAALALAALAVRQPRRNSWAPAAAAAVLCLIAVSYLLSRTTGLPLLIGQAEQLDPLGIATTAAELAGVVAGAALMSRKDRA